MRKIVRCCSSVLACALLLGLLSATALSADLTYIDENGETRTRSETTTTVTDSDTAWSAGWYVASGTITISSRVTVSGEVHLILADGCALTVTGGIKVTGGNSLTIYAQSIGDSMGKLTAGANADSFAAGIGGNSGEDGGAITINGGAVTTNGGHSAAGIGGGKARYDDDSRSYSGGNGGIITINGGTVTATGGANAAGIGGGEYGNGTGITISGGAVTASGGTNGAGIGGGFGGYGGTIAISGGTITASGGGWGAGIGGGAWDSGGTITVSGGTVTATGGTNAAGIGGGGRGSGGAITINGGAVTATGGANAAGIGGGDDGSGGITIGGAITIGGGTIETTGGTSGGYGISGYTTLTILDGAALTVPSGHTLTVPEGAKLTVGASATLTNNGTIVATDNKGVYVNAEGALVNNGTIDNTSLYKIAGNVLELWGNGTKDAPYQIPNWETLVAFRNKVNGGTNYANTYFMLTKDIDLSAVCGENVDGSAVSWTPIGNKDNQFEGSFCGGEHKIDGLYINAPGSDYQGLFGYLGEGGEVKNLVVDGMITGNQQVGGVCGYNKGSITGCSHTGTVAGYYKVGGVCGENYSGTTDNYIATIEDCHNTGVVSSTGNCVGGVCGYNYGGMIKSCYNKGAVSGDSSFVGGVCGESWSTIANCYNTGVVSGTGSNSKWIGGVCGVNNGQVTNCYNTGAVSGTGNDSLYIGGVCGEDNGPITNCYSMGAVTGGGDVGGVCGLNRSGTITNCYYLDDDATGDSAAEEKTAENFASGEVAQLLQGDRTEQVWGQTVGCDHPELTSDHTKAVYKVIFRIDGDGEYAVRYGNQAGLLSALPDAPTKEGYTFTKWAASENGTAFTNATCVTSDMTLNAYFQIEETPTTPSTPPSSGSSGGSSRIYYTVTAQAGVGGSIVPSGGVQVIRNGDQSFTITADEGYAVAGVLVDGQSVGAVTGYTFEKVNKNHSVEVSFQKVGDFSYMTCPGDSSCPLAKFKDVDPMAWYHDGVHYCVQNGLMVGTSATTFAPDMPASRAMIVTILWRQAGCPVVNYLMQYDDVEQDAWYAEALRWATSEAVVAGYGNGSFGPDDPITREQLATILYRYDQLQGGGFTGSWMFLLDFTDRSDVSQWAYEAICFMTMHGVIEGKGDKLLDPQGQATRAEIATMLLRHDMMGENE